MRFADIKHKIKNNPGFESLKEIKEAGYRIVRDRDGDRYFLARQQELKPLLVRLGDIAEVKFGIKTGANEFFYLDEERLKEWKIEKEFLKPIIKSPRECKSILIKASDLKFKVFMCHKDKKDLKGTNALKYIEWGEESRKDTEGKEIGQFHKRPSCSGRQRWWNLNEIKSPIISKRFVDVAFSYLWNKSDYAVGDTFFVIDAKDEIYNHELVLFLNSTIGSFLTEITGRKSMGEGVLLIYGPEITNILVIEQNAMGTLKEHNTLLFERHSKSIFQELGINPNLPIRDQKPNPLPDRKAIDDVVFDILGLTQDERNEVYWAVCELVKNRLAKAKSI